MLQFTFFLLGVDPVVTLNSNVTFGGVICPMSAIRFTCTANDATVLEWRRNKILLTTLSPSTPVGTIKDNNIPPRFMVELVNLEREGSSQFANFTSILIADLSVLVNGKDQITCDSLEEFCDTINITYSGERSMSVWSSHAAMETIILYKHTHTQLLLQLPSSLTPSPLA